jgi:alpha-tubulin suppressor-like RCC1 family protein
MRPLLAIVWLGSSACGFRHGALDGDAPAPGSHDGHDTFLDAPITGCAVVEVAANNNHTCARLADGTVWCWGRNHHGQSGVVPSSGSLCGTSYCQPAPHAIAVPPANGLGLGDTTSCALAGGDTYCWGANGVGEFGTGGAGDSTTPVKVAARAGATTIIGGFDVVCSLAGGTVGCSGGNDYFDVGDGTNNLHLSPFASMSSATALGKGYEDTCAIVAGGVQCWGLNGTRQIDSTLLTRASPTAITGVDSAVAVTIGLGHACALRQDASAMCWGDDGFGQLGDGQTGFPKAPVTVGLTSITQLVAMSNHTCALTSTGGVWCWGEHYTATPAQVTLPHAARSIASGWAFDCATLTDGSLWCWGANDVGQLGNGLHGNTPSPPVRASLCT